jgi:hypothetical protein
LIAADPSPAENYIDRHSTTQDAEQLIGTVTWDPSRPFYMRLPDNVRVAEHFQEATPKPKPKPTTLIRVGYLLGFRISPGIRTQQHPSTRASTNHIFI